VPIFTRSEADLKMNLCENPTCARTLGITLGVLSALSYTFCSICIQLVRNMDGLEIVCLRACLVFALVSVSGLVKEKPLVAWRNPWVWGITLCWVLQSLNIVALKNLPAGDVAAILYCYPILVGILACVFLKEPFDWLDALMTLVIICGVMFVVQPTFLMDFLNGETQHNECLVSHRQFDNGTGYNISDDVYSRNWTTYNRSDDVHSNDWTASNTSGEVYTKGMKNSTVGVQNLTSRLKDCNSESQFFESPNHGGLLVNQIPRAWACLLVVLAAIGGAVLAILLRKVPKVHTLTILSHSNLVLIFYGVGTTSGLGRWVFPNDPIPWVWLVTVALTTALGQALHTIALKYETAAKVAIAKTMQIPFTYILQIALIQDVPNAFSAIGAAMVTMTVMASGAKKLWQERKRRKMNATLDVKHGTEMNAMLDIK
jgi:drug/metabolite transporter (DMT)-like permease